MSNLSSDTCSSFAERVELEQYIQSVKNVTGDWNTGVMECRKEICTSLLGGVDPDLAGLGVISGYIAQNVLGYLLSLSLYIWRYRLSQTRSSHSSSNYVRCLEGALDTHQNSAIFFAFIIQITTMIFQARVDYGAGKVGLSGGSSQLGWTVSLLTFIPLLYPLVIKPIKRESGLIRRQLNMLFILGCGILHGYIALSRFLRNISRPLTGIPLLRSEWEFLGHVCYDPSTKLSKGELDVSNISAPVESLIVFLLAFYKFIAVFRPFNGRFGKSLLAYYKSIAALVPFDGRVSKWMSPKEPLCNILRPILYLGVLPLFAATQGYVLMRMRREQKGITQHVGSDFTADRWSFGQIASLLIWMPVLVEPVCILVEIRHEGSQVEQSD